MFAVDDIKKLDKALAEAERVLANKVSQNSPQTLERVRLFAGNDTRILNRLPVLRKLHAHEQNALSQIVELRQVLGRLEGFHGELM